MPKITDSYFAGLASNSSSDLDIKLAFDIKNSKNSKTNPNNMNSINSTNSGNMNSNGLQKVKTKRVRKKHKNSRYGCQNCKNRKIKCDETLPTCVNCNKKKIVCTYTSLTPYQLNQIMLSHQSKPGEKEPSIDKEEEEEEEKEKNEQYLHEQHTGSSANTIPIPQHFDFQNPTNDLVYHTYNYPVCKEINLQNRPTHLDGEHAELNSVSSLTNNIQNYDFNESVYKISKLEEILLPPDLSNDNSDMQESLHLHTELHGDQDGLPNFDIHFTPIQSGYQINEPSEIEGVEPLLKTSSSTPLFENSKFVNKTMKLNRLSEYNLYKNFIDRNAFIEDCLAKRDIMKIFSTLGPIDLDTVLPKNYYNTILMSSVFSKLVNKSILLYACDYYKNILLRQNILPSLSYKEKLSISCFCENYSINSINNLTKIIENEYIINYGEFKLVQIDLLIASFMILSYCLVYHFKNGLKFEMSEEEGDSSVHNFGIFNTGLYSVTMDKSKSLDGMNGVNILALYLTSDLKFSLVKGYNLDSLDDYRDNFEQLDYNNLNNIDNNNFIIDYQNLKTFSEKYLNILKTRSKNDLILGFKSGFIIRLLNEFQTIIPYDLCNLKSDNLKMNEETVILYLNFIALGFQLSAITPATLSFATNDFVGRGWFLMDFFDIKNLMSIFNTMIFSTDLKIQAIYLIRTITFFKKRWEIYKSFLKGFKIDDLIDTNVPLFDRCDKIRKLKHNGIMDELQMESFKLKNGFFIQKWNFPTVKNTHLTEDTHLNDFFVRITLDKQQLIASFTESSNGLLLQDYDPLKNPSDSDNIPHGSDNKMISTDAGVLDGQTMRDSWKLVTYMRLNNV